MRVDIGDISKEYVPRYELEYLVLGIISRVRSLFANKLTSIHRVSELLNYINEDDPEYLELSNLLNSNLVTLILRNSFVDNPKYHSYITPIGRNVTLPTYYCDSLTGVELVDWSNMEGKTYVVEVEFSPNEVVSQFYINLPTNYTNKFIDSEFVNTISISFNNIPPGVDQFNDVANMIIDTGKSEDTLLNIFNEVVKLFSLDTPYTYIYEYLAKNSEIVNLDNGNKAFRVYYNQPVKYLPKSITPDSLIVRYGVYENRNFLCNYIPENTVTFESKLLGDTSKLHISLIDGILIIELNDIREEFEVSGDRDSSNFIGDVISELVNIQINGTDNINLYNFDTNFITISDLYYTEVDINKSISNLLESELETNGIILSDTLYEYNLNEVDLSKLNKEILFASKLNNIDQLKDEYINVVKFTGTLNNLPVYVSFINTLANCDFGQFLSGVPNNEDLSPYINFNVWVPNKVEFYNVLDTVPVTGFNYDLGVNLDNITTFHIFYSLAISKFLLRYKYQYLFTLNAVSKIRDLLNKFKVKFSIINSLNIEDYEQIGNDLNITLNTKLNAILKYNSVILNFKIII